jgi:hypothetical protein
VIFFNFVSFIIHFNSLIEITQILWNNIIRRPPLDRNSPTFMFNKTGKAAPWSWLFDKTIPKH